MIWVIPVKATSGPIRFEASIGFETYEGGTRLSMVGEAQLGGFFRIAEPIVIRMGRRQIETKMANLKDLLEGPGVAAGHPSLLR